MAKRAMLRDPAAWWRRPLPLLCLPDFAPGGGGRSGAVPSSCSCCDVRVAFFLGTFSERASRASGETLPCCSSVTIEKCYFGIYFSSWTGRGLSVGLASCRAFSAACLNVTCCELLERLDLVLSPNTASSFKGPEQHELSSSDAFLALVFHCRGCGLRSGSVQLREDWRSHSPRHIYLPKIPSSSDCLGRLPHPQQHDFLPWSVFLTALCLFVPVSALCTFSIAPAPPGSAGLEEYFGCV